MINTNHKIKEYKIKCKVNCKSAESEDPETENSICVAIITERDKGREREISGEQPQWPASLKEKQQQQRQQCLQEINCVYCLELHSRWGGVGEQCMCVWFVCM